MTLLNGESIFLLDFRIPKMPENTSHYTGNSNIIHKIQASKVYVFYIGIANNLRLKNILSGLPMVDKNDYLNLLYSWRFSINDFEIVRSPEMRFTELITNCHLLSFRFKDATRIKRESGLKSFKELTFSISILTGIFKIEEFKFSFK